MIFRFNIAQLGAKMEKALITLLDEMQKTQKEELEIIADEFPYNFIVKEAGGSEAKISWDADAGKYNFVCEHLPDSTATGKNVDEIKDWHRPESSQAPEPAPEIKVTVNSVVAQFMGLPVDQRPAFFEEVWKLINAEVKG